MGAPDYKVESSIEYDSLSMNLDDKNYLKNFLTKQMCKILLILFFKTLSNKDLAKQMGISTSALSNILQRMKKSQIKLFIINKEDKYIFYSLTPIAYAYVKDNLIKEEESDVKILRFNDEETSNYIECTENLNKLKVFLSIDTAREFESFFELHYMKGSKEKREALDDFIISLAKMNNEDCRENFNTIISNLDDEIFRENILHCVNLYQSMMRLCDIYDQAWELAYDFVDSFFKSKGECVSFKFLSECKTLEPEIIAEMGSGLFEIVNISNKNSHSKDEFMDCWKIYVPIKQFMRYIAVAYENWMNLR